jgi:four helix bundle protein
MLDIKVRQSKKPLDMRRREVGMKNNQNNSGGFVAQNNVSERNSRNEREGSLNNTSMGERLDKTVNAAGHTFSSTYHTMKQSSLKYNSKIKSWNKRVVRSNENKKVAISSIRKIIGGIVMFVGMMTMFIFTELTTIDIFFWLFFFGMFWYRLDSRISIGGALVGLVIIMLLSAGQGFGWWQADNLMEQIAVGVYFFLVIGVVKQIWEYKREKVETEHSLVKSRNVVKSMKIEKFEDIISWQKSKVLTKDVYLLLKDSRDYGFRDQIQRASVSIMNNIAEGFERRGDKEFRHFLFIAKGSCGEVRSMLYLALELEYITKNDFEKLSNISVEISKLLSGFIKTLK